MKRSVVESLERRKDAMIAALWSNSNYDDDKGTRRGAIEEIEQNFQEAVDSIHGLGPEEEEIDPDNPFFAPAMKASRGIETPRHSEGTTVKDVVDTDYSKHIDQ